MTSHASRSNSLFETWVRWAARHAPAVLRERLEEEWLADLGTRRGPWARLRFAVGCSWASRVIAVERPALTFAHATPGIGSEVRPTTLLNRRAVSLVVVVSLHALIFYAGWHSLARATAPPRVTPFRLTPVPLPERVAFRPDDKVDLTRFGVPVPTPPSDWPIEADRRIDSAGAHDDAIAAPGPLGEGAIRESVPPVQRAAGAPGAGFPNVDDYYPATAIRASEQGAATVQVCVNARGVLNGAPALLQPTGFASLDAAALRVARAGSGHYRPAAEDGHPVASCFAYVLRFQIRNVH